MNESRKLAAILAADVVGFSRLAGADEERTLARLRTLRSDVIDPTIAVHRGRVVKRTGDGILVEFRSVIDAVRCAIEVQDAMVERNAGVPPERRIEFRVGIHLGDVVEESDGDLMGDGVNIAARLEGVARPGTICLSEDAYRQVRSRVDLAISDLGETKLKNIAEPIRIYSLEVGLPARAMPAAQGAAAPPGEPSAALTLPDKPSIAVLPFQNMSGDPQQEYFADGITEDIITALSRVRGFFVIARNTTFAYKGQSVDVRDFSRLVGVGYVLEGSVRKSGNRVRVTAQLIDGSTGNHVWAQRYDRELIDIFELQDSITETIVGAIEPEIGRVEREQAKAKRPENLRSWDLFQRGMWHTYRRTKDDLTEALRLFSQARDEAPDFAPAYAGAEEACFFQVVGGYSDAPNEIKSAAVDLARRAVELDTLDAFAHYALGRALTLIGEHKAAIPHLETAIGLNPSFAQAYYALGMALGTSGRPSEAIPCIQTAMRLSPHDPYLGQYMVRMSEAHLFMRSPAEAADWARQSLRQPNIQWSRWACLASALGHLGTLDEARRSVEALKQLKPEVSVSFVRNYWPIADASSREYLLDGLRKAGLPE